MAGDDTRPPGVKHVETSDLRKAGLKITLPRLKTVPAPADEDAASAPDHDDDDEEEEEEGVA